MRVLRHPGRGGTIRRGAVILAALALLVTALLNHRAVLHERQAHYGYAIIEHAWALSELQIETKNLVSLLYGHAEGSVPLAEVQLAFDILWSRIGALGFARLVEIEGLAPLKADYLALLSRADALVYGETPMTAAEARTLVLALTDLSARTRRLWSNEFNQNRARFLEELGGSARSATRDFDMLIGLVALIGLAYLALELALADRARQRESDLLAAANSASELKSSFLANMSHEVRTPLNGVIGATELLRATALDPDQAELLQTVSVSAEHLLGIVNQVLDLTKIEAGRMEIEDGEVSPEALAREVVAMFAKAAADKGVGLRAVLDDDLPARVRGDPLRLRQVLINLVSNAVRFTERGEVTLEATATPGPDGLCTLCLRVRDTGIGIDRAALRRVMDPFVQGDVSHSRRFGGTGLGLTISRQLVALMGGDMDVDSEAGKGTTVTVRVPLPRLPVPERPPRTVAQAGEAAATPETGTGPARHALRVLVAEDNATNLMLIRRMIGPHVTDLVTAADGRAAVDGWRAGGVDVIFMDIQMPGMGGVEATALIRAEEREAGLPAVPIYSVSANALPHQLISYMGAGMTGHLSKPFRKAELLDVIARHAPGSPAALCAAT